MSTSNSHEAAARQTAEQQAATQHGAQLILTALAPSDANFERPLAERDRPSFGDEPDTALAERRIAAEKDPKLLNELLGDPLSGGSVREDIGYDKPIDPETTKRISDYLDANLVDVVVDDSVVAEDDAIPIGDKLAGIVENIHKTNGYVRPRIPRRRAEDNRDLLGDMTAHLNVVSGHAKPPTSGRHNDSTRRRG